MSTCAVIELPVSEVPLGSQVMHNGAQYTLVDRSADYARLERTWGAPASVPLDTVVMCAISIDGEIW